MDEVGRVHVCPTVASLVFLRLSSFLTFVSMVTVYFKARAVVFARLTRSLFFRDQTLVSI